jgi:putative ABC transport system substrate-binding protein
VLSSNQWGHMRFNHLNRREFITLLGVAAAAWPHAARAQQPAIPVIGFLHGGSLQPSADYVAAFRQGLKEAGYVEGQNVTIEFRWAEGRYDRLPELTSDFVRPQVAVIVASTPPAALTARMATNTIPIVFVVGTDPVQSGLVASLNRPAGNMTGFSVVTSMLVAKRVELLRELVPSGGVVAILVNPKNPNTELDTTDVETAVRSIGRQTHILRASSDQDLVAAFGAIIEHRDGGLLINTDPFFYSRADQIVALAARHAVPTIYDRHEFVALGGLISYGTDLSDIYRQAGIYTGRILKGAKPADLPVQQPTKFELVINLKTAKALGLMVPLIMQMTADKVIE